MEKRIFYIIRKEDLPCTVEGVMRQRMGLTKHQIRSAKFRPEGITINGVRTRITGSPLAGDRLEVCLETAEEKKQRGDFGAERKSQKNGRRMEAEGEIPEILYEDEDLLLVNKPAGVPVHPGHGHYRDTLANQLLAYFKQTGEHTVIRAVGRLDKDTSGIVVFARNQVAAARLAENGIRKEYLALVEGHLPEREGCVELPIGKKPGALNEMEISRNGSFARTRYQVLEEYENRSLVRLHLDTGRTHQIRVHMAALGCPLVGDPIYERSRREGSAGTEEKNGEERRNGKTGRSGERDRSGTESGPPKMIRAALHCVKAEVRQPFSGEWIVCRAALPEDFLRQILWEGNGEEVQKRAGGAYGEEGLP